MYRQLYKKMNTTFKTTKELIDFIYSNDFNEAIYGFYNFKKCTIKERVDILMANLNVTKTVATNAAMSI